MADLSDVETALVATLMAALAPATASAPAMQPGQLRIYRGWPLSGSLDADLLAGIANVSVFAVPAATRNTTRWRPVPNVTPGVPTLTVSTNGGSATFGGVSGVGQMAGLLVENQVFVYQGQAGDTPAVVAAVLADAVRASMACWLSGTTLTIPGATKLVARVAANGASLTEWARQEQGFRISAWCPNPMVRDAVCGTIGASLAQTAFLTLADGTAARIRYRSTSSFDDDQDAQLYRRDLVYDVEYGTSIGQPAPSMLFGDLLFGAATLYA